MEIETETELEKENMSFLATLGSSRYLKKEDATPTPLLLTIKNHQVEDVSQEGEPEKMKTVLYFYETEKGFVLGPTTGNQIASFLGDPGEDPRPWYNKKIVLYNDPNVTMKGKLVGGLRVRAPRNQPPAQQQAPPPQQPPPRPAVRQQPPPPPADTDDTFPF